MTRRRRITIIVLSVLVGTLISAWIISSKRGGLGNDEFFLLGTNLVMSFLLIGGIGYILIWRKKK